MKRSLKKLIGYPIECSDGSKGFVKDFLFDERTWTIRYLEADLGVILPGKRVLIPRVFLKEPDWKSKIFPIELSTSQIEECKELHEDLPISREYEKELNKHYQIPNYWSDLSAQNVAIPMDAIPPRSYEVSIKNLDEEDVDSNLRSLNEVVKYQINAIDNKLGQIEDLIVDDLNWMIVYAVADTSKWMPWSKKVLIGIPWLETISYVNQEVSVDLDSDSIKGAPEFDPTEPVNEVYEKKLYDFYGAPVD